MDRLDEIRARLEKATPGPWERDEFHDVWGADGDVLVASQVIDDAAPNADGDAELIVNAPSDLVYLLRIAEAAATLVASTERFSLDPVTFACREALRTALEGAPE